MIHPSLLLQRVCKITPLETITSDYLKILLMSSRFHGYFEPELTGVSVPHISADQIANFRFPYLRVHDQERRAKECLQKLNENAKVLAATSRSTELLRERRAALITAAVTGQIDVREQPPAIAAKPDRRLDAVQDVM